MTIAVWAADLVMLLGWCGFLGAKAAVSGIVFWEEEDRP